MRSTQSTKLTASIAVAEQQASATVRKQKRVSQNRFGEAQIELTHANRVAAIGRLAASIAHEIKQPLAAAVANAWAASRWLGTQPPNLEEARAALDNIVEAGNLASAFVDRAHSLVRKAPPRKDSLDINETVREVVSLVRSEVIKTGILLEAELADDLPIILADRVQLQQVMLNLIMNAVEAMSEASEGSRELLIRTGKDTPLKVDVIVQDSGPGFDPKSVDRIFDAFYTTKLDGMGVGLSICRSIIEAHQGQLWASANTPRGAVFQFTLPAHPDRASRFASPSAEVSPALHPRPGR